MTESERDLRLLLRDLDPVLCDGSYVFTSVPPDQAIPDGLRPLAMFREAEGTTLVIDEATAQRANLPVSFRAAWITLRVSSDLHAVGLTAAVSSALADRGICCNVIAGAIHDHLFVPSDRARDAVDCLRALSEASDIEEPSSRR